MDKARIFTVSEANAYIKQLIEKDLFLSGIYVNGEISNLKIHTSGHMYFTLKDKHSSIRCVMFKSRFSKIKFKPEEGLGVVVRGYFSIYERSGQYQLYAESIIPEGTGVLYKAFEQLKERLQMEGLFDNSKKMPLPFYPKSIAIVTSPTGAAVKDIISIIKRRNPSINIGIYPVLVQGENAPKEIAEGINHINNIGGYDAIIVGRGGGSIEELWAFNEEIVARAIYNSCIPVISAVGHETDFTIADFVADVRAATPSAAAELIAPEKQQLKSYLDKIDSQMNLNIISILRDKKTKLETLSESRYFRSIETKVINFRQTIETLKDKLNYNIEKYTKRNNENLKLYIGKLGILNPESYLLRGYAYVKKEKKNFLVTSIEQIEIGDNIKVFFKDGNVIAQIRLKNKGVKNE
ncbi:MAG: exodeoxyribonuclease VII large subunit [Firmicutes bacterium]|nr:exodeoxyribonuclease VII large subunit [Bacillota bacterium]